MPGFITLTTPAKKTDPTPKDKELAHKLRDVIKTCYGPGAVTKWSSHSWANEIRLLTTAGVSHQEIETTIQAFTKLNHKDQYTPKVYSAASFRTKYPSIINAVQRLEKQVPTVQVSETALSVAMEIKRRGLLSGKTVEELAGHIQVGIERTRKFSKFLADLPAKHKLIPFLDASKWGLPKVALSFHESWWVQQMKSVSEWGEWSGNLAGLVWCFDHRKNVKLINTLSADYCGKDTYAKLLTEAWNDANR